MGKPDDIEFKDAPRTGSEWKSRNIPRGVYIGTPDRLRRERLEEIRVRWMTSPRLGELGRGSPDDSPEVEIRRLDEDMPRSMHEVDENIMAAAVLGADITELYSPGRVAQAAIRFGLASRSSFDLASGGDVIR